ncbi:DNA cytosine methyltransferase [Streptomyces ipomoeae]|uniref:DNA cytosine methyltransferase n=1 Tax=Streptomyces ipomoeae TaxID=103232 RepID=UPI0011473292|nr:DNA cytosine methyltransferase [Streptomyces ipomoeae]MDX2826749.1 DNA cytosine methyltransferase [Streptomyces ipomoeae]MDX2876738.1 DNA cytosine methyltransferase [Streptomyces ipomoeae]TQE38135.1 DNA cytosine methyltransferase [Streptomyces ipomoeae]
MNEQLPHISAVDLFCGVGGLTHGLVRSGIDVRAGVDLDPHCKYPFEANNSAPFIERDVNDLAADELNEYLNHGDISLLAGCAPCQPFSTYSQSGRSKKRGLDWQLVLKFGALVEELQPDLVTMENVAQLAKHQVFDDFLKRLRGYAINWSVVECAKIGVPQSRKRLVLIASKMGSEGLNLDSQFGVPLRTVRQEIGDLPRIRAGQQHKSDPLHISPSLSDMNMRRIKASKPGGTWRDWDPELIAACHRKATGSTYPSVYGRMEWDAPAPTITTQCFGYGNGRFGHPVQDRAISLREAAMLQTFPRDYQFLPKGEQVHFNRLGRLIGNAVPVRLGEAIGNALIKHVQIANGTVVPTTPADRLF